MDSSPATRSGHHVKVFVDLGKALDGAHVGARTGGTADLRGIDFAV